jgi:peptidoglycan/LPS O-acetylase OafA/YrhL
MWRVLVEVVLPFLLPFLAFVAWRLLVTRGRGLLDQIPWYALTVLGLVLVVASLVSLATLPGVDPDVVYEPPHVEGGKVVPGRFVPVVPEP